jgi:SAM-dependent methyltransferase
MSTMANASTSFEERARGYIAQALPHGSAYERQKLLEDWLTKEEAAKGIVADFVKRAGPIEGKQGLDLGFGNGITLAAFAEAGARMSGLEVVPELRDFGVAHVAEKGITADLELYDGSTFPFPDTSFDFIYSVSVFEHVSHPADVLREAARVLRPGGVFYLAYPNRLNPKETHTGVWFLSYLPRPLAKEVLTLLGHNSIEDWNLFFRGYFWLVRLLREHHIPFAIQFETKSAHPAKAALKRVLATLGIHQSAFLPHVMVVLRKT